MSGSQQSINKSLPGWHKELKGGGYFVGDLIDNKYRLTRTLGEGGMGVVWVARNIVLDVDVALKLIPLRKGATQPALTKRLLQEARTAAQLSHPAICRVYDYGRTHLEDPFIVSELMHGETLGDIIDIQDRMPASRVVQILLPVIDGLAVAHAQGIVHRDVKPDNIFLSRDVAGRVQPKLLDFGIARFVQAEDQITVDGALLGTPNYMSPEQARGEGGADFRTDVWSVAVVLYEAVTGELPFEGDNYNAILYSVINQAVPSILNYGAGDAELWRLIERGLEKDPQKRWQSMRELGEALALWLYDRGILEDVCGASLRTTWLEGSVAAPLESRPEHLPPSSRPLVVADAVGTEEAPIPLTVRAPDSAPPSGSMAGSVTLERVRRPRIWRRVALGALTVVLMAAVGAAIALRKGWNPAAYLTREATSAGPVPSTAPAPVAARPGASALAASATLAASAAAAAAPSASASATAAEQPESSPELAPTPQRRTRAARPAPAPVRPKPIFRRRKKRRDFGF